MSGCFLPPRSPLIVAPQFCYSPSSLPRFPPRWPYRAQIRLSLFRSSRSFPYVQTLSLRFSHHDTFVRMRSQNPPVFPPFEPFLSSGFSFFPLPALSPFSIRRLHQASISVFLVELIFCLCFPSFVTISRVFVDSVSSVPQRAYSFSFFRVLNSRFVFPLLTSDIFSLPCWRGFFFLASPPRLGSIPAS